jgi:DNA repair photolyase
LISTNFRLIFAYVISASPPPDPGPAAAIRGRGAAENPTNRFERLAYVPDPDAAGQQDDLAAERPPTVYLRDPARSILATNTSPDVNFAASLNPYRGCEHGCSYCYARPTHEYLGFSSGLDFETRILVKEAAPELLRRELSAKRWRPQIVGMCGVTDAYQPIERRLELTRRCLQVFAEFRNPVQVITKNGLVTRDKDVLSELAQHGAASVSLSITSLDAKLLQVMEPRASHPLQRLRAIEALAHAGIPVGVMVAPVIPGLTDHEMPAILRAARDAGASYAGHTVLRLPRNVKELFSSWLERHHPDRRDKVLNRLRALRGGRLDDARFGTRMKGAGIYAEQIHDLFALAYRKAGFDPAAARPELSTAGFRRPGDRQLDLF